MYKERSWTPFIIIVIQQNCPFPSSSMIFTILHFCFPQPCLKYSTGSDSPIGTHKYEYERFQLFKITCYLSIKQKSFQSQELNEDKKKHLNFEKIFGVEGVKSDNRKVVYFIQKGVLILLCFKIL